MSMQVTAITHKRAPVFVSIVSQVTPSESSVIKRVAYEPLFLAHLRDTLAIKGIRRVVHARAADQLAQGDVPAVRARRAAHAKSGAACTAPRPCRPTCGKIVIAVSEDIDPRQCRRGVLVARLSRQSGRRRADRAAIAPPVTARRPGRAATSRRMLIDATLKDIDAAAGAAEARVHGARAQQSGTSSACRRSRRSRRGTAIRSATGTRRGTSTPAARSPANGKKPARKPSRGAAAVSRRKRR